MNNDLDKTNPNKIWQIEYLRVWGGGKRWEVHTDQNHPFGIHPLPLEACIITLRKFHPIVFLHYSYRIRNLVTEEKIPVEALGL